MARLLLLPLRCQHQITAVTVFIIIITHFPIVKCVPRRFGNDFVYNFPKNFCFHYYHLYMCRSKKTGIVIEK